MASRVSWSLLSTLALVQLVGLFGTFSWVIVMDETARAGLFEAARRMLRADGVEGEATIPMAYRSDVWRAVRDG